MGAPDTPRLREDPLFLACTRPAMVAGVPMEAMGTNLVVSASLFLALHGLAWLLVAPALHLVFRAICRHDPNAFRVLWLWTGTRGRARNLGVWGGSSPAPLPVRRRFSPEEVLRG